MNKSALIGVTLAVGIGIGTLLDRNLFDIPHNNSLIEASAGGNIQSAPLQRNLSAPTDSNTPGVTCDIEPLRAELALALDKLQKNSDGRPAVAQAAPVPEASPEQRRDALQAVDTMINSGRWGEDERNAFHQKMALLDPQQREQAMQTLVQALNSGNLKSSIRGAPF